MLIIYIYIYICLCSHVGKQKDKWLHTWLLRREWWMSRLACADAFAADAKLSWWEMKQKVKCLAEASLPLLFSSLLCFIFSLYQCSHNTCVRVCVCTLSQLVCMLAAASPVSPSWNQAEERRGEESRREGGRWWMNKERDRDATGWNEKAEGGKKITGWERCSECRADVCFPRLHSVSLRLPSALHTAQSLCMAAQMWRHCSLAEIWTSPPKPSVHPLAPFRCSLLRCSSGQRGKFFPAVPLSRADWPIEIVLPPLTEQRVRSLHLLTKIRHLKPNRETHCHGLGFISPSHLHL